MLRQRDIEQKEQNRERYVYKKEYEIFVVQKRYLEKEEELLEEEEKAIVYLKEIAVEETNYKRRREKVIRSRRF